MPGMMETVLNIGLNEKTIEGLIAHGGEPRFAYDAYRRLIMMYADVVMEKASGIEISGKGIRKMLDEQLESIKKQRGYSLSLIHISEPTRLLSISYAVFCLKKKKKNNTQVTHNTSNNTKHKTPKTQN